MKSFVLTGLLAVAAALPRGQVGFANEKRDNVATLTAQMVTGGNYPTAGAAPAGSASAPAGSSAVGSASAADSVTAAPTVDSGSAAATGAAVSTKKSKSACKKKHKTKTKSFGTAPTGTGSASRPILTSSPAMNGTSSGSGSSSNGGGASSNGTISSSNSTADNTGFLRGINVGHWLILEKWMDNGKTFTGKFGGAADQWSFDSIDGSEDALQKHWDSWFTEADVAKIAGYGFNALRIPIGYWAFDNSGTPYKKGAVDYLDKALGWAGNHNMKVLIDLHGSPGSQNGQDHSGHSGKVEWQQGDNMQKSTDVLVTMAKKYGAQKYAGVVWGIETVNEPTANQPNNFGKSQSWAQDAYEKMHAVLENKALRIVTHDSFMGPQKFIDIASNLAQKIPVAANILSKAGAGAKAGTTFGVDQHDYQLYTDHDNSLDQAAHIKAACGWADNLKQAHGSMPTIVGEWSSLTNICANDDGSTSAQKQNKGGSCTSEDPSKWSKALVEQVRRYVEAQLDVYEQNTDGYFLWSYNGPGGWGLEGPVNAGAFPKHVVNDRKYKGQCGGGKN